MAPIYVPATKHFQSFFFFFFYYEFVQLAD